MLADSRGLIQENRPQVKSTLEHLNDVSGRLQPVLDDLRKTSATANQALDHVDALIGEDRPDILTSVNDVQTSLKHPMMLATAFQESSLPIARRLLTECLTKKNERK